MSMNSSSSIPRIQVFRPTSEEFKDFSKYIEKVELSGAHKAGLAKIIPPEGWCPRKGGYDDIQMMIPSPISQMVTGRNGLYQQYNIQKKAMSVKEFKKMAESNKYKTPPHFDYEDLERKYWKNITYNQPIYGADVSGSLYDKGIEEFNIQHLNTILDMVKDDYEIQIEGVNTAYLYFGMWKTSFAWHTEDMDLYSINYLHFGAPKSWYVVPPEHGRRLERLASNFFHGSYSSCAAFLRHKMTIISPQVLKHYSIPFNKITQEPGEFMITFPFGYHSGFNHGYNCAESTNFALPRWVEYGKRALSCTCRNDCVKICMDMFIRKFQPDKYELWKMGKDYGAHPEDPSRHYAAPAPKKLDLALAAQREERKKAKDVSHKIKRHPISRMGRTMGAYSKPDGPEKGDGEETELYDVNDLDGISENNCEDVECCVDNLSNELVDEMEESLGAVIEQEVIESESSYVVKKAPRTKNRTKKKSVEKISKATSKKKKRSVEQKYYNAIVDSQDDTIGPTDSQDFIIDPSNSVSDEYLDTLVDQKPIDDEQTDISGLSASVEMEEMSSLNISESLHKEDTEVVLPNVPEDQTQNPVPSNSSAVNSPIITSPATISQKNTLVLNNDLLQKFPTLREAISNGTLALTCVKQIKIPQNLKKININIGTLDSTVSHSSVAVTNTKDVIQSPTQNSSSLANVAPIKINAVPNATVVRSWYEQGTWKCEHTQGLKVKFVQPKQMISQFKPNDNSQIVHQAVDSTVAMNTFISASAVNPLPIENETVTVETSPSVFDHPVPPPVEMRQEILSSSKNKERKKHSKHSRSKSLKSESESLGSWAQPILELFQHRPHNFEEEKKFNEHCSTIEPHCSICVIFMTSTVSKDYPLPAVNLPSSSRVRMPSFCFGDRLDAHCVFDTNPLYSEGNSPLLVCSQCKVCVHATCYGITMLHMRSWICSRCASGENSAECCLCVLRGGALKPTTDGRWAHVICAVLIPEASFENVILKEPVNVSKVSITRQRLKCKFCFKSLPNAKKTSGACIQCLSGKCYLPFHATCGFVAGVIFEASDWPEPINIICTKHSSARRKSIKRSFTNVEVGDKVLAKHKNKRYYWVEVSHIYTQEYYSILFDDNSTSTNTLPEDVVWREVTREGCPNIDEKIRVKWTDGKIYNAIFKNSRPCEIYVVQFEDDTMLTLQRSQIYAREEALPREIVSKISHSTERRHFFKEDSPKGKRPRTSSEKFLAGI